jgi:hypothetical protein
MRFLSNMGRVQLLAQWAAATALVLGSTASTPAQDTVPLEGAGPEEELSAPL